MLIDGSPQLERAQLLGWTTRVLEDVSQMNAVAGRWNALGQRSGNPIGLPSWGRAAAAVAQGGRTPSVVVVEQEGEIIALAPLAHRPGLRGQLELLGLHQIYEPTDFLYRNFDALDELARAIRCVGHPLFLWRVPAESPAIGAMRRAMGNASVRTRPAMGCPYIDLDDSWSDAESRFSSRRRSDFRRARRRAEALGELSYEMLAPGPAQAAALFEEAVAVEAAGWKGQAGTAMSVDGVKLAFYREWVLAAAEDGILRMCFLRINGEVAAMQLAAESGRRFWLLKIGYDERFARASPGQLLMLHTLSEAASRGLRSYEFLGSVAHWTEMWTKEVRECVTVRVYPPHWRSLLAVSGDSFMALRGVGRERRKKS